VADTHPQLYRRVAWGPRPRPPPCRSREGLETSRFRFRVIHTPGHATDHVALFEPERGGSSRRPVSRPRLRYLRADEDVYAMMDSLRRVLALEPRVLFCRAPWARGAGRGTGCANKLDFLVELGGGIHELHRRGWSDAAIARALPGSDLLWRVWTGGDFSKRNFVRAFLRTASAR